LKDGGQWKTADSLIVGDEGWVGCRRKRVASVWFPEPDYRHAA
jgi:hypothetical protein